MATQERETAGDALEVRGKTRGSMGTLGEVGEWPGRD